MASLGLAVRMLVSLAAVIGLLLLASRLLARSRSGAGSALRRRRRGGTLVGGRAPAPAWLGSFGLAAGASPLSVVARRSLSRHASLLVVQAGRRYLLLAATPQSVQLLTELSPGDLLEPAPGADDDLDGSAAPGARSFGSPWMVQPGGRRPLPAWDALLTTLRERTVRR